MAKYRKKRLTEKDRKTVIKFYGETMTVGFLYSKLIDEFNVWWDGVFMFMKKNDRLLYERMPQSDKQDLKFIAKIDPDDYKALDTAYKSKVKELTELIPIQYRYAFSLERNFKYIDTNSFYLKISDSYTVIKKDLTLSIIKAHFMEEIDNLVLDDKEEFEKYTDEKEKEKKIEEKKIELKRNIMDQIIKMDPDKKYYTRVITAKKFQINYYDRDTEDSVHTGLGHAVFVPMLAKLLTQKKRKKRNDIKIPTVLEIDYVSPVEVYEMTKRNGFD